MATPYGNAIGPSSAAALPVPPSKALPDRRTGRDVEPGAGDGSATREGRGRCDQGPAGPKRANTVYSVPESVAMRDSHGTLLNSR